MRNFIKQFHWLSAVNNSANTCKFTPIYRRQSTNQKQNASVLDNVKIYITKFVNGCRTVAESNEFNITKEFVVKSSIWSYQKAVTYYKNNIEKKDESNKSIGDSTKTIECGSAPFTQPTIDTKQFIAVKDFKMSDQYVAPEKCDTDREPMKMESNIAVEDNNIKK